MRPRFRSFPFAMLLCSLLFISARPAPAGKPAHFTSPGATGFLSHLPLQELHRVQRRCRAIKGLQRGVCLSVLSHGCSDRKEVALTFDDGPHKAWTPALLDLLKSLHVRATFFVVGKMVDKYPELVVREVEEGHEVANHTYSHPNLKKLTEAQVEQELRRGADAIRRAVGYAPVFFRPPGGQYNAETFKAAAALKYTPVLWTANSKDFVHPDPNVLEERLLRAAPEGGIFLCHDGIPETTRALPEIVSRLRARGYHFVTISEMARHRAEEDLTGSSAVKHSP